jgi:hypothetical protein
MTQEFTVQNLAKMIPLLPSLTATPSFIALIRLDREFMEAVRAHPKLLAIEMGEGGVGFALEHQTSLETFYLETHELFRPERSDSMDYIHPEVRDALAKGMNISFLYIGPTSALVTPLLHSPAPEDIHLSSVNETQWTSGGLHTLLEGLFRIFRGSPEVICIYTMAKKALPPH